LALIDETTPSGHGAGALPSVRRGGQAAPDGVRFGDWPPPSGNGNDSQRTDQYGSVRAMSIGVSVFLIALGAIFAFALRFNSRYIDLPVVGYVLMAAGAIGIVVTLLLRQRRRVRISEDGRTVEEIDPPTDGL
jgi:Domain of unknown function (DUF6458)